MTWIVILFCLLLFSASFLYREAIKGIPSRLQPDQAPLSDYGIVPVQIRGCGSRIDRTGVDIVFVHGLGSNPDTTWRAKKDPKRLLNPHNTAKHQAENEKYVCWITDFLPDDIPSDIRENTRIFFYNHDSFWQRDAVQTRLSNLGQDLLSCIRSGIRRTEEECSRRLVFVAYSFGGLIVKQALIKATTSQRELSAIADNTKAILFLGTPHRGSSISRLGMLMAWALQPMGSNPSILAKLAYDSLSLLDLHRDFVAVTKHVRIINFFEERKAILLGGPIRWNEFIVREQSATYDGSQVENHGLGVDHYGLNKFGSRNASYSAIHSRLLDLITTSRPQLQKRTFCVPLTTVSSYTERHNLSSAIEDKLLKGQARTSRALAIHGLGGTGKTQLALKFLEEHKEDYNPVLWIDAKNRATVQSSFERCATELQLTVPKYSVQEHNLGDLPAVKVVLGWLQARKQIDEKWLLVFDNVDDLKFGIKYVIPQSTTRGTIIITSQDSLSHKLVDQGCERLLVDMMTESQAVALLLRHIKPTSHLSQSKVVDHCRHIVQCLGYLALAIDLAGAYISEDPDQDAALQQYAINYNRHKDILLKSEYFRDLSSYDKTVWTVWDTTLEKIRRGVLNEASLLSFLAHFNREVIQDELFRLASQGYPDIAQEVWDDKNLSLPDWVTNFIELDTGNNWDSFKYLEALKVLVRYNLVQWVRGEEWAGVTMHNLVQWRARSSQDYDKKSWNSWYLAFILAVCRQLCQEGGTPRFRRYIIAHLPDITNPEYIDCWSNDTSKVLILTTFAKIYDNEGQWKKAQLLLSRSKTLLENLFGREHPKTLCCMVDLSSTYRSLGQLREAEDLGSNAMQIQTRILGKDHPDTVASMISLAWTYGDQGRLKETEELETTAMNIRRRILGQDHPDTISIMANLVATYQRQGRFDEAENLGREVLQIREKILGMNHTETVTSMANLALIYRHQGRFKDAEDLGFQAMKMRELLLGNEHPDTMTDMANLALIYWDQGRFEEAEKVGARVIEKRKIILGADHPHTLTSMANLALTYRSQGRHSESANLAAQVAETRKNLLGTEHPDTLTSVATLSVILRDQDKLEEAERLALLAINGRKRVLGDKHPHTLSSLANLVLIYKKKGEQGKAEDLGLNVLELRKKVLGDEHPDTITSMSNLSLILHDQGRLKDAKNLALLVVSTRERVLGEQHPETLASVEILSRFSRMTSD